MVPISRPIEPITEDDAFIEAALLVAHLPSLLPALALLTGDHGLLRDELRPDPTDLLDPQGGLSAAAQQQARELALEALTRYRGAGCPPAPPPRDGELKPAMEWIANTSLADSYLTFFTEELGVTGVDPRAPGWRKDDIAAERPLLVAVIGAGMSGLVAAHRLGQAGVPYVVIEKNDDVGGTWLENTYPGCRVDVPSHLYSYTFAQRDDWPQHFSSQEVLLDYFRACATDLGVRDNIRFRTEVLSATWSDERGSWLLELRTPSGTEQLEAHAVVSAVGQLNRPSFPAITGRDRFDGPSFHSAQWDHTVDLTGKRVAVIGTGASAAQLVPIIAERAAELRVFQRTANWFAPTFDYHEEFPDGQRWLMGHVPGYSHWYRFWLFWRSAEGLLPAVKVDPDWEPKDRSVSELNDQVRVLLGAFIEAQVADDPELCAKVVPTYPPAAKRIIRDNGAWISTLRRDNVELITDEIEEITTEGVVTVGGDKHDVDVIIYATGFTASQFLTPMRVVGRGGVDLHESWDGDARAYLGITVPGFPNLFCLYGPNTNIVINSSIIFFSEAEVDYVLGCIKLLLDRGHTALDPRRDVFDAYNERIDEGNRQMAWGASSVNTWYKNAKGRVTQNWPFSLIEYWEQTRQPNADDYELL
jgi:4-hydroxyacetophenone monooxygenase